MRIINSIVGLFLFSIISLNAFAEGSYQAGLTQPLGDLTYSVGFSQKVDIVTIGEVINISVCGANNTDNLTIEIFDATDTSVHSSSLANSNVDCADPFSAALTNPIRYTTLTSGTFTIEMENTDDSTFKRFDITVTADALTDPDPTIAGGRLWAYGGKYNTGSYAEAFSTDADYYALVPGGRDSTNYVWKLDLNNFSGYVYTLVANDLGVDSPLSGYSIPSADGTVSAKFPQYLSYPDIADPRPNEPPVLTGGLTFIDDAGQDYAISPGTTNTVQDSGVFEFNSDVEGTYAITIDTNSDGVFGAGDKLLLGNMVVGLNPVPWDGTDPDGVILSDG